MSKSPKNSMKIAEIGTESLHIFWPISGIQMKLLGKMLFMKILKATKEQCFTFSSEDKFLEKKQGGGSNWPQAVLWFKKDM